MLASLKKIVFAVALTFCAATGMTIASAVVAPAPAEAGILSSVKRAATSVVTYSAGRVTYLAKVTARSAKLSVPQLVVPVGKSIYQGGKSVVKVVAPVAKVASKGASQFFGGLLKKVKKTVHRS